MNRTLPYFACRNVWTKRYVNINDDSRQANRLKVSKATPFSLDEAREENKRFAKINFYARREIVLVIPTTGKTGKRLFRIRVVKS